MNGDPDLPAIRQSHTASHGGKWPCMAFLVRFKAFKAVIQLPFPLREAQNPAQGTPFYGMNMAPVRREKERIKSMQCYETG